VGDAGYVFIGVRQQVQRTAKLMLADVTGDGHTDNMRKYAVEMALGQVQLCCQGFQFQIVMNMSLDVTGYLLNIVPVVHFFLFHNALYRGWNIITRRFLRYIQKSR
jgi:hypothetical protein